jgi:hypothetical protein
VPATATSLVLADRTTLTWGRGPVQLAVSLGREIPNHLDENALKCFYKIIFFN